MNKVILMLMIFTALLSCKKEVKKSDKYKFLVGTYTQKEGHVDGKGEGIYVAEFDMVNKSMKILSTIKDLVNPSFLVATNNGTNIYCVNEISPNDKNWPGRISLMVQDSTGYRKSQEAGSFGNAPCHISINPKQSLFAVTNYLGGTLCYGNLDNNGKMVGKLEFITFTGKGAHPRQDTTHLHQSIFTKDGSKLLVTDLGSDSIRILDVDNKNNLITYKHSIAVDSSDGPRHMTLSDDGKYLYVLNELSNTVSSFEFDGKNGDLKFIAKVKMLPSDFNGDNTGGDIHLSKNGQYLFATNRGHNSIVTYKVDGGKLELKSHTKTGDIPRNFTITNDGAYLFCANQNSDDIYIYEIETNGNLHFIQKFSIPTPVCLQEI